MPDVQQSLDRLKMAIDNCCEWIDGYGEDRHECNARHTHLIVSHEYPTPNIVKSCYGHVLIQASQLGMSTFTVVDVRMYEQVQQDAADYATSLSEEADREEDYVF